MDFDLPVDAKGKEGLLATVEQVLKYSVNTWDQGFLDKLYASTNAVGVISELILAVLNTNVSLSVIYEFVLSWQNVPAISYRGLACLYSCFFSAKWR